ncbi:MAG: hypothetical protein KBT63_10765 [Porticoccaceae bacterium]|nr:hypothetical protein [Porticoccaceae bacterium]
MKTENDVKTNMKIDLKTEQASVPEDNARRAFLKHSAYAAYTTPAILSLVVSGRAAATSHFNCPPKSQNPGCP